MDLSNTIITRKKEKNRYKIITTAKQIIRLSQRNSLRIEHFMSNEFGSIKLVYELSTNEDILKCVHLRANSFLFALKCSCSCS